MFVLPGVAQSVTQQRTIAASAGSPTTSTYIPSLRHGAERSQTLCRFLTSSAPSVTRSGFFSTRLQPGRYLVAHKAGEPFVTLLKEAVGKVTRGAYDLQKVHGGVLTPPASGPVPWIPVDPALVLPFHQKHGQIPCCFPMKPTFKVRQ